MAVAAPLLAEIPIGLRVPTVILEVMLGVVIDPNVLGLARAEGFLATMGTIGMSATRFMAGLEPDWQPIRALPCPSPSGAGSVRLRSESPPRVSSTCCPWCTPRS